MTTMPIMLFYEMMIKNGWLVFYEMTTKNEWLMTGRWVAFGSEIF